MTSRYFQSIISLFIIVGLLFIPTNQQFVSAQSDNKKNIEKIDTYITEQMNSLNIPGVAIGIVQNNEVVYVQGYGVADDNGRAMTADTPLHIASLSKSFTALAIMQLVEEGKIELDAPVQTYLPWFRVADEKISSIITVRHLLHQTSGFDEREGYVRNLNTDTSDDALEKSIRDLQTDKLNFTPGETFEYANTNYDILGLIVQTVSGQSYEEYVEEKIFAPLDMNQSFTSMEDARAGNLSSGYYPYFGFTKEFDNQLPYSRIVKPSAGLFSSTEDLTHYLIAHLNDGQYQGNSILSSEGIDTLHRPGISFGERAGYGMGWTIFPFTEIQSVAPDGVTPTGVAHRGDWLGYYSIMVIIPELETGIVVLMNKSNASKAPEMFNIGWSLCMLAVGLEPLEAGSADFVERNIRILLLVMIVLLSIGFVWSTRKIRTWSSQSKLDAIHKRNLTLQTILLAIVDLALAGSLLFIRLPLTKDTISLALRFNPDVGLMYVILLILTLGCGTIRTYFFLTKLLSVKKSTSTP